MLTDEGLLFGDTMPFPEYLTAEGLSFHGMKDLAVSPLHYWHKHRSGQFREEDRDALRWGRIMHTFLLEPDAFGDRYAVAPRKGDYADLIDTMEDLRGWLKPIGEKVGGTKVQLIDRAREAGCELPIWDCIVADWEAANDSREKIKPHELQRLNDLRTVIESDEKASAALSGGYSEVSMFVRDPETNVLLKCRIDKLKTRAIIDLKTFDLRDGQTPKEAINRAFWYLGYFRQGILYHRICGLVREKLKAGEIRVHGDVPTNWLADFETADDCSVGFLFVQGEEPFHMDLVELKRSSMFDGARLYWSQAERWIDDQIKEFAKCEATYGDRPWRDPVAGRALQDLDMPQQAYDRKVSA